MIGWKFCNVYFALRGVGKVTPDSVSDKQWWSGTEAGARIRILFKQSLGWRDIDQQQRRQCGLWLNKCVHTLHTQFDMMGKYFHFKYSPGDYCLNSMLSNNLKVSRMLEGPEVAGRWVWHNRNTGSQGDLNIVDLNDQSSNCFFILFFYCQNQVQDPSPCPSKPKVQPNCRKGWIEMFIEKNPVYECSYQATYCSQDVIYIAWRVRTIYLDHTIIV